jgi:hypothetical protein
MRHSPMLRAVLAQALRGGAIALFAVILAACASRTRAAAACTVWLETLTSLTSLSRSGSEKASHHGPLGALSRGSATFQPCASLNVAEVGAAGRT